MEDHKDALVAKKGEASYNEEKKVLEEMIKKNAAAGKFETIEDLVDTRSDV